MIRYDKNQLIKIYIIIQIETSSAYIEINRYDKD